jgi:Fic family protein
MHFYRSIRSRLVNNSSMNPRFQTLNSQLAEWQTLQPIKREDHNRLWRKLRLDWNYHSNHIEGNTLTYGETEILLIHGQVTGDHGLRDYIEMRAHDVAIEHLLTLASVDRPLTEADIRDFNRILIKDPFWKDAITADGQPSHIEILPGEYKKQPNNVRTASGDVFLFADPVDVQFKMNSLVNWLREALETKELHPIEIASKLHHDFVLIHPFGDGNGRTARILVNYVVMRNGYLPLIVRTEQKDRYLGALRKADTGDIEALTDYLATCAEASMNRGILAAKGESIEEQDDLFKEIELFKRRQNGEAKNVIPKSPEALLELYQTTLRSLFAEYVDMLSRLDGLFTEAEISAPFGSLRIHELHDMMDKWATRGGLVQNNSIQLTYELRGFKGNARKPFNVSSQISVSLSEFHYTINVAGKNGENRLYGQPIAESERKVILRPALEILFAQIKKQSGEK